MGATINHRGKVLFVEGNRIDIEMEIDGKCSECLTQKSCGMQDSDEKIISLYTESASWYEVGEDVMVSMRERKGVKAAIYYYMIPFFIIIAVLFVTHEAGLSELDSALSALGAFVGYNIVLYIMRNRIEREMDIKLEKLE